LLVNVGRVKGQAPMDSLISTHCGAHDLPFGLLFKFWGLMVIWSCVYFGQPPVGPGGPGRKLWWTSLLAVSWAPVVEPPCVTCRGCAFLRARG